MAETKKNTFLMFCDWKPIIDGLSNEQVGHMIKGIFSELAGEAFSFSPATRPIAIFMLEQIKKSNNKYEETCKRKSEAAKRRAEKAKHSNTFENIPKHSNTSSDNENDNEYENDNENEYENEYDNDSFSSSKKKMVSKEEKEFTPPSIDEVNDFFYFDLVNEEFCIDVDEPSDFYSYNQLNDWRDKNGKRIKNWKVYARNWHKEHERRRDEVDG